MTKPAPKFGPEALKFLRALKRNNRREWFQPRKEQYERDVRAPMQAIVEQLAIDMRAFAPEVVVDPKKAIFRIYRDTRFADDKTPYKTNIAASFGWRGLPRWEGAGLYFQLSHEDVWIGGGMYQPPTPLLQKVREHIVSNHRRLRSIVASAGFKRVIGELEGEKLQRVPRGFDPDHPAAEFLRHRQFLAGRELAPTVSSSARFYPTLIDTFKVIVPVVRFLNEPLKGGR
jgi:uncharacterized protein (TIGR02453 family)